MSNKLVDRTKIIVTLDITIDRGYKLMFLSPQEVVSYIEIYKLKIKKKELELPMRFGPGGPANESEELVYKELAELNEKLHELLDFAVDLNI